MICPVNGLSQRLSVCLISCQTCQRVPDSSQDSRGAKWLSDDSNHLNRILVAASLGLSPRHQTLSLTSTWRHHRCQATAKLRRPQRLQVRRAKLPITRRNLAPKQWHHLLIRYFVLWQPYWLCEQENQPELPMSPPSMCITVNWLRPTFTYFYSFIDLITIS